MFPSAHGVVSQGGRGSGGGGAGTISFIGAAQGASSVSLPAHQAGDLILAFAVQGSSALPGLPAGWTNIRTTNLANVAARLAYRIAADDSTPSGSWSPAAVVLAAVYRGAVGVGASTQTGVNNSSSVAIPPLASMDVSDGSSWVVGVVGRRQGASEFSFADLTNRQFRDNGSLNCMGLMCDTNAGVAAWGGTEAVSLSTSLGIIFGAVELLAA